MPPTFQTVQLYLSRAMIRRKLGHALLLVGEDDANKRALAHYFAMMLLCKNCATKAEVWVPCDNCTDCVQIRLQRHANIEWIVSADSGEVRIDQIREVRERLRLASFDNRARLIVLANANALTTQAANALLKSIEEPKVGQYFLLMATSSSGLPKTLVSRCQKLILPNSIHQANLGLPSDNDLSRYAESVLNRIRNSDLHLRVAIVEEIAKHACDKTDLLLELQKLIHQELRQNFSLTKTQRSTLLKSLEATEHSRFLLEHNSNTQLTLEHWLLNAWPTHTH